MIKTISRKYRLISILSILAVLAAFHPAPSYAASSLTDLSNHWAKDQINAWIDSGYIKGYPDGTFKPDNNITRAEFMTLVNNAYGLTEKADTSYTDVAKESWYSDAVAVAKAAGYITGYPDNTMKPDSPITRQEAAVIVSRIDNLTADEAAADQFTDGASIPSWSKGAIGADVNAKIFTGYPDGSFKGENLILRGETVVALDKAKAYTNAPISVTKSISNTTVSGFQLNLTPAVDGLTTESAILKQGDDVVTISAITTEDHGATYTVSADLTVGQAYSLHLAKDGYSFGDDSVITVISDQQAADAVTALIKALPELDQLALTDEDAVNAAKKSFDALTDEQASLISADNAAKLNQSVTKINDLKAAGQQSDINQ